MPKKTTRKNRVQPYITPEAEKFFNDLFDQPSEGLSFALEAYPVLYRQGIRALQGKFSEPELMLMIDLSNGLILMPQILGQHMIAEVEDGCALERLDEKWSVDKKTLLQKLNGLTLLERSMLEIFCNSFWMHSGPDGEKGSYSGEELKKYISVLL